MTVSDESSSVPSFAEPDAELEAFAISRRFHASQQQVFAAWTEEEHLKHWFGPSGFTIPVCRLNLVPGGMFHYCMRAANGVEMWGKWIFQEIEAPNRIVFVNTFSNKHGYLTRHPYVPEWPLEIQTTTTLSEEDGETTVQLEWVPVNASAVEQKVFAGMHGAMAQGWNGTFDQLAAYLATI